MKFHYFVEYRRDEKRDHLDFYTRCGKVVHSYGSFNPEIVLNASNPCRSCLHHIEQEFPSLVALRMIE